MTVSPSLAVASVPTFASADDAIAAVLRLVRDLLGLSTAVVTRTDGGEWLARYVDDGAFGLRPGDTLPLQDTF